VQEIERSAASVEEAIESALEELGISEQEAEIEVVQEPRGGFLRLNAQPAVVRVRRAEPVADAPAGSDPAADAQAEIAATFVEGLTELMGIEVDVEISGAHGATYVDIWGVEEADEDVGLLIGKGGHTLDALQELVRSHIQRETGERCLVLVDAEDYRKRRRSQLVKRVRDIARRVQRSGKPESLTPMTAYERKVVHDTVADIGGLETASEGEEPERYVVIRPGS
jgi:spoIIIJ-associated protein